MLGNIHIYRIHKRFAYTKSMVDLVNVPNVRYNQGLQGLSTIIGGSVSTERPCVPSALSVFLRPRVPGFPWASLGIPGPPLGFPWASLGFPGAPWASLGLPGPPWASLGAPLLGLPGPPDFGVCVCAGPPLASLGLLGHPWVTLGPPGVVAKAFQIPRMCSVLTL